MDNEDTRHEAEKTAQRVHSKKVFIIAGLCLVSAFIGSLFSTVFTPNASNPPPNFNSNAATSSVSSAATTSTSYPVEQIAKIIGPTVVGVNNYQSGQSGGSGTELQEVGSGSGFIIDAKNGYIVTNDHVINGANQITVNLADGRLVNAKVVGADPNTDLAVLRITANNLKAAQLGDSSKLIVGQPVVAIGNPGGEQFARSVTAGVTSALNRTLDIQGEASFGLIQTDAAINPGNSGGPLVNYQGQIIGINSAKYAQQGFEGMGFSIPISNALPTIVQLIKTGAALHPALKISINDQYLNYAQQNNLPLGAYISQVTANGPAAKAGLQQGDVITKINGVTIQSSADLIRELYKYQVGTKVTITYLRNNKEYNTQATLGEIKS
jgi:serine protease Do